MVVCPLHLLRYEGLTFSQSLVHQAYPRCGDFEGLLRAVSKLYNVDISDTQPELSKRSV